MTAPDLSAQERATVDRIEQAPDALGLREEVLAALPQALMPVGAALRYPEGWGEDSGRPTGYGQQIIDALLPLIERREAEARADAEESARTAWAVHSEHVENMNRLRLHDMAVAEERGAERALRDAAADGLLQQRLAVGWACDHDFKGATCAWCFRNIDHAAEVVAAGLMARADQIGGTR